MDELDHLSQELSDHAQRILSTGNWKKIKMMLSELGVDEQYLSDLIIQMVEDDSDNASDVLIELRKIT